MPRTEPIVRRSDLQADCTQCFSLCCVAPAFSVSADFAIDKGANEPCPNLGDDSRCQIHDDLRPRGFAGCTVYDCFGAGQKISQVTFGGRDWRDNPGDARDMFATLWIMAQLHELMWYLTEALQRPAAEPLRDQLQDAFDETERLTFGDADAVLAVEIASHRERVNALLSRAGDLVRADVSGPKRNLRGAELLGADLVAADLRGANLRGARLVGAVLRGADLQGADLTGADVRGADVAGADLRDALFLRQAQVDAARGDARTRLPAGLSRPGHWSAAEDDQAK